MIAAQGPFPLQKYHTFGLPVRAAEWVEIDTVDELAEFFAERPADQPLLVLGGGSNVLFRADFPGTVMHMNIKHRSIEFLNDDEALVRVGAGEPWSALVAWTLEQNLGGLENLSLIPGQVGAAPIQNIGAYGVELKDVIYGLEAYEVASGKIVAFLPEECGFAYRYSHFKGQWKGQYVITRVSFKLTRRRHHLHLGYGAIQAELSGIATPGIRDVAQAVIRIRQSKLPDPRQLGNAGSFFKNPVLAKAHFVQLKSDFPDLPGYLQQDGQYKVPAAWLIDACGWKGKRQGPVGCYEKQPLVIVNYGGATGTAVWAFAQNVMETVQQRFGILLDPEVNILP